MFLTVILKDMLLNLNSPFSVSDALKKAQWQYCMFPHMPIYDFSTSEFTIFIFFSIINIPLYKT